MSNKENKEQEENQNPKTVSEEVKQEILLLRLKKRLRKSLQKAMTSTSDYIAILKTSENVQTKKGWIKLKFAGEDVYKQLIPVMDDFERQ